VFNKKSAANAGRFLFKWPTIFKHALKWPRSRRLPIPSLVILFSLYFSQGLPSGILAHTLPALMRDEGVALEYIGLIKLLALPWALKFLWAPYIDRIGFSGWGPNKSWIVVMQLILAGLIFMVSFSSQAHMFGVGIFIFLSGVLLVNTSAATQDIATDGLAVKVLPESWRGLGNSIQVAGFKAGMILSGSLLLLGIDAFGWSFSFSLLAGVIVLLLLPVLFFKPAKLIAPNNVISSASKSESPWLIYKTFFNLPSVRLWLPVLVTYKAADSLGSAMIKPLLIDQGFGLSDVASLTFVSSFAGLLGAFLGGLAYYHFGQKRVLLTAGLMQALGIAAFALIAYGYNDVLWIYSVSLFEQMADGISTVALFSLMMAQCRSGHEGADFTVQASIQVLVSGVFGALSGVLAAFFGFSIFFVLAGLLGLLALLPAVQYFKHNY